MGQAVRLDSLPIPFVCLHNQKKSKNAVALRAWFSAAFLCVFVLQLCKQQAHAQTVHFSGIVSTVGSGFNLPRGTAVDRSGNIFVADTSNNAVKEIVAVGGGVTSSSTVVTVGSGFSTPEGVAVDASGNVFVADYSNSAVKEIVAVGGVVSSSSTVVTIGSGFSYPLGVAVDGSGNVFVADGEGIGKVKEIVAVGGIVSSSSTVVTIGSGFSMPLGVAVDGSGNVFVADSGNSAVKEIVAVGGVVSSSSTVNTVGSGFNHPESVAVDGSGNVFVGDTFNFAVKEIVAVGGIVSSSSTVNTLGSGFNNPFGVTVDGSGNVFVADGGNNAVKQIATGPLNFGSVAVVTTTPPTATLMFNFDTGGTIAAPAVLTQGAVGKDFTDAGTGTCTTNGTSHTYSAGDTCTVIVTFKPTRPGLRMGGVQLIGSGGAVIATENVYGTGTGPMVTFPSNTTVIGINGGFNAPFGVAVDGSGNVFVAEAGNSKVKEIVAVSGVVSSSSAVNVVGSGFSYADGVAVDGSGNVFVADTNSSLVKEIVAVGGLVSSNSTVNIVGSGFNQPEKVTVDGSGNVFVADTMNGAVKEIVAVGGVVSSASTVKTINSGFSAPYGVAVDGSGNVFVADYGHGAVKEIVAVGGVVSSTSTVKAVGSGFTYPDGIAVDANGNVFVVDYSNTSLKEIVAVGGVVSSTSTVRTVASGFNHPYSVAVDGSGNIFVGDTGTGAVREIDLSDPPSLSFASTLMGTTSSDSPKTVTVANSGNAALTFPIPSTGSDPSIAANFTLNSSGGSACPLLTTGSSSPGTLASGSTCFLPISFTPATFGAISGSLVLTDTNLNAASPSYASQTIPLSGTGTPPIPTQLVFTTPPTTNIAPGGNAGSTITLWEEDGSSNLAVASTDSITLTVTGPSSYSQTYTQTASGGVATFNLSSVVLNTAGSYTYAATSGVLTQASATETVVATSYTAPTGPILTDSATQTATLLINSSATLNSTLATAIQVLTKGAANKDFVYATGGTCAAGASYTTGQTCTVNFIFTPKVPGQRLGAIQLYNNSGAPVLVASVHLSGTGTGPLVTFPSNTTINTLGSGFSNPMRVVVDGSGNVFVADHYHNAVKEILAAGGYTTVNTVGSGFGHPAGVAMDGSGNIFVADEANNAVKEIVAVGGVVSSSSTVITVGSGFHYPDGVAVDGSGNVFVADAGNSVVKQIVAVGGVVSSSSTVNIVGSGFNVPYDVTVDVNGNLFVADYGNSAVKEIVAVGGIISSSSTVNVVGSGFNNPIGVVVDGGGNIFVADYGHNAVKEIVAVGGAVSSSSTVNTLGSGFSSPSGVAVDGSGNVFVADYNNSLVKKIDLSDPPSLSFASTAVGSTSSDSPKTVTVTNAGNASLTFPIPTTGNNPSIAANFTLNSSGGSACPLLTTGSSSAATLAPGSICTLPVSFTPIAAASNSGSLVLTDTNLNAPSPAYATQSISLSGTGTKATPAVTLSSSGSPTNVNASVTLTATVAGSPTATGTITFNSNGTGITDCSNPVAVNGSGVATCHTSILQLGVDSITASYSGDANYNANTSNTLSQTVNAAAASLSMNGSPASPQQVNTSITFTAQLAGVTLSPITPNGTVTFLVNGSSSPDCPAKVVSTTGSATCTTASLPAGASRTVSATYSGDTNFTVATAGSISFTVFAPSATLSITPSPASPQSVNTPVTFTAQLSGTLTPVHPTGLVTWTVNGASSSDCPAATVTTTGSATCTTSSLPVGANRIVSATYSGDSNFTVATAGTTSFTVTAHAITLGITPSPASPQSVNTPVTFTAQLSGTLTPIHPTGLVTWTVNGASSSDCPAVTVTTTGSATCTTSSLPAGANRIVSATYSGDSNFTVATAGTASFTVTAFAATLSLTASPSSSTSVNTPVVFTAQLAGGSLAVSPSGTVAFKIHGGTIMNCFAVPISSTGSATCTDTTLTPGTSTITAEYAGDSNYTVATPGSASQSVSPLSPTLGLTASPSSSTMVNAAVTFTAQLAGAVFFPMFPAGNVNFTANGSTISGCGAVTVNSSGRATCTTSLLAAGSDLISATYSGDYDFTVAAPGTMTQTVTATTTTTAAIASAAYNPNSQTLALSASVTSGSGTVNTGTVTFAVFNGATQIGVPATSGTVTNGSAGVTYTLPGGTTPGTYSIQAVYNASAPFATSSDNTHSLVIGKATATVTLGSLSPTYTGSPLAATATSTPSGLTVNFTYNGSSIAPTSAGSYTVVGTISDSNYTGTNTGTLVIGKATLNVTANSSTSVYGVAFPTFTGTLTGVIAGDGITATYSTTATPTSAVGGVYSITATLIDPNSKLGNYSVSNTPAMLTINQATQTITFTAPTSPVTFGVTPFALVASGGASGNAVTYSVVSGPGTISGGSSILLVTGAGTIVVAANQAGNTNYSTATQVTQSIVVNQASQTITLPCWPSCRCREKPRR